MLRVPGRPEWRTHERRPPAWVRGLTWGYRCGGRRLVAESTVAPPHIGTAKSIPHGVGVVVKTWRARFLDEDEVLLFQSSGLGSHEEGRAWVLGVVAVLGLGRDQFDTYYEMDGEGGGLVTGFVWDCAQ